MQEGEKELHNALFGTTEGVPVTASSNSKAKAKRKRRRKKPAETCTDSLYDEDGVEELATGRLEAGEGKGGASLKRRKRKQMIEEEERPTMFSCKPDLADSSSCCTGRQDCQSSATKGSGLVSSVGGAKRTALRSKVARKMEGARFRWINEQLYTTTGNKAKQMFDEDPSLFDVYHSGFATQVSKWPLNPLDKIIAYVRSLPADFVIADFGCGEARLAQSVSHTVHSFDLVATNSSVTACDMAHVPLPKRSVNVAVFCLSLMGSNVSDFIREARRVLKNGGVLKICEIASRMESVEEFIANVELFGFKLIKTDTISKMFLDFEFRVKSNKDVARSSGCSVPNIHLNPCIYKRR